uniref:O-methyltransferase family protein n=1 Tax=uncultured marine thaumarchaeote AD1000_18_B11 TaxID=1455896 RepID=A0A075FKR7_9ARCH|nr:O-methyltransferase family protein [uncultured marine thaumarchaeote AD1000_18_B11]
MINEKIQNVLSRLEKDIDYENSHRDEVPSEKRLNCISKNIGTFYNIMLKSICAKNILEIGMSVGYSGLWFADAIMSSTQDGQIITIDREQFKIDTATRNFEEAGVSSLIKIREGEARKILHEIKEEFGENYFDFIFIDADKESYIEYFDLCLPLVRKGGIIAADNILFPERFNEMMTDYLSHVRSNPNVQSVTVPIDNGEEVTIKL